MKRVVARLADARGRFAIVEACQFLHRHARHVETNVDAVKDQAGDALLVFVDHRYGAGTLLFGIPIITTRARVFAIYQFCSSTICQRTS